MPKSYLKEEDRVGLDANCVLLAESMAAGDAGDENTAWEWLRMAELPAAALLAVKRTEGADFVRNEGLRTDTAEQAYGRDWLDRDI